MAVNSEQVVDIKKLLEALRKAKNSKDVLRLSEEIGEKVKELGKG